MRDFEESAKTSMHKNRYKRRVAQNRQHIRRRMVFIFRLGAALLLLSTVSLGLIFGYDFFTQWDYFKCRRVDIQGLHRLTRSEILTQAQIRKGVNVLAVNLTLARKRLLAHPWIAEAQVRREMPDRIFVRVREQKALAIVDFGRRFLINTQGQIFKKLEPSDHETLPLVTGLNLNDLNVAGAPRSRPFKAIMSVLRLGSRSKSVLPNTQIRQIRVDRDLGLTLEVFNRRKIIKLGFTNYPGKYSRLVGILDYLKKRSGVLDFAWIDLQDLNRVVVSPMVVSNPAGKDKEV